MTSKKIRTIFGLFAVLLLGIAGFCLNVISIASNENGNYSAFFAQGTAKNGNVALNENIIEYSITGAGSYYQSPDISAEKGSGLYCNFLVKNTIEVFMKNDSEATEITLYFKTTSDNAYSVDKSVILSAEAQSGYQTYYFNLSENTKAAGLLTGFRISPSNASLGAIYIKNISFQREKAIYDYSGKINSCIASQNSVTVKGTLDDKFSGKTVSLYSTDVSNFDSDLSAANYLTSVKADGGQFEITIPLYNENVSNLSVKFIVSCGGVKVSEMFGIENYSDFTENPYAFALNALTVNVSDYGALGDGFTDDTKAIQNAIDYVNSCGGGKVVLSDDGSLYGKHYVVTSVSLKSNVELCIEKNAVLMQSERAEDYKYEVVYGHDITLSGAYWTHSALCSNYPLIYASGVSNIKITGGGTVRMSDIGRDSVKDYSSMNNTCCKNRIHLIPIGMYNVKNILIDGISIIRSSSYHIALYKTENVCISGITLTECADLGGDGISIGCGTKNVVISACGIYCTDDAVVLWSSSKNEKRGITWWHITPDGDNAVKNIDIEHSFITGGHGITFVTWGTDSENLEKQEISDITVIDNVLGRGGNTSIAGWYDNPYYGASTAANGYAGELKDYSSVKNLTVLNNLICGYSTLTVVPATNVLSDSDSFKSSFVFVNADFERSSCQQYTESDMVSGLSYWSYDNGSAVNTAEDGGNHYACVDFSKENANIYEGLYLTAGSYTFKADIKSTGSLKMFARSGISSETIVGENFDNNVFESHSVTFTIKTSGLYQLGISGVTGIGSIDNASITCNSTVTADTYFTENFDGKTNSSLYTVGFVSGNGNATSGDGLSYVRIANKKYDVFDLKINLKYNGYSDNQSGFSIRFAENQYDNNYVYYELRYLASENKLFLIKNFSGIDSFLITSYGTNFSDGSEYEILLKRGSDNVKLYIDGKEALKLTGITDKQFGAGNIRFISYYSELSISGFEIAAYGKYKGEDAVYPEYFTQNFESADKYFSEYNLERKTENGNTYVISGSVDDGQTLTLDNIYKNFDFKADIKILEKSEISFLKIKFASGDGYYFLEFNLKENTVKLKRHATKDLTVYNGGECVLEENIWHTLGVSFKSGNISVWADGVKLFDCSDYSYAEGSISITTEGVSIGCDNISADEYGTLSFEKTPDKDSSSDSESAAASESESKKGCKGDISADFIFIIFAALFAIKIKNMKCEGKR